MGRPRGGETTKQFLKAAPLPTHGKTYAVVSHTDIIDNSLALLKKEGFTVTREMYRSDLNAKVAQGIYHLIHNSAPNDPEMGMMFAWTNSYDKTTSFQCGIGAHVFVCANGLIHGDMSSYKRKHTGNANADIASHITTQIGLGNNKFKELVIAKDTMKTFKMDKTKQAELAGRLYIDEKLLDSQQLSIVKSEMNNPSYNYGVDPDTAWMFYNSVTHAFKKTHPRNWMSYQSKFHKFMESQTKAVKGLNNRDTPDPQVQSIDNMDLDNLHDSRMIKNQTSMNDEPTFNL